MAAQDYVLEMKDIVKRYSGVKVLNNVNFKVKPATVMILMGENGAGKSTLMKILEAETGIDSGKIIYKGREVRFANPRAALQNGISMIHQEFNLVLDMSIADNLFLGREIKSGGFIKRRQAYSEAREILKRVMLDIKPSTIVRDLTVAQMQMVEIAKAVSYNSDIIIMDEPTSAISESEIEVLFNIIRKLKEEGRSVIYISHKIEEVFEIGDEITILRDGNLVHCSKVKDITKKDIIKMMVNREIKDIFPKVESNVGDVALSVRGLSQGRHFHDISFDLHEGEILGFAGLMGSGRTETAEAIFGITKPDKGTIEVHGKKVKIRKPKDAIENGIGMITDDRKLKGLVMCRDVKENTVLSCYGTMKKFKIFLDFKKIRESTQKFIDTLGIKTRGHGHLVEYLSGGNQQKVVLAKWLMKEPRILILDEPTRGIDVGAKSEIYKLMAQLAALGNAILFISSEQQEIVGMSHRVLVFHEGSLKGELNKKEDISMEKIMLLATDQA